MRPLIALLVLGGAACGGVSPPPEEAARRSAERPAAGAKDEAAAASCAPRRASRVVPAGASRQGSAVALVRAGDRLLAYVADADSRALHTVDVDARRQLAKTPLGGSPREVLVLADGRVVVTLADASRVAVLAPEAEPSAPLDLLCERSVPAEPWGLAADTGGTKLAVTSAWAAALTVLDATELRILSAHDLPRDPRSVLVDEDGRAWIGHLTGAQLSVVDLPRGILGAKTVGVGAYKVTPRTEEPDRWFSRSGGQGYALASVTEAPRRSGEDARPLPSGGADSAPQSARPTRRILAPMVSVDPGDFNRRSAQYYGPVFDGVPKQAPMVGVVDPERDRPVARHLIGVRPDQVARECLLPRAAAVRASSGSLFVACMGIDAVVELDAWALEPSRIERRRFSVPVGPTGIAVDDASGRAVVFSQFAGSVTVLDLDGATSAVSAPILLEYEPDEATASSAVGRALFYQTDQARIANDGLACASCHPDARDDGLTWATPEGPRQTLMLSGRTAGTAPYGWVGHKGTLDAYVENTVLRLGGKGLAPDQVRALVAFIENAPVPPVGKVEGGAAARGREIFFDAEQGCATCHVGGAGTDGATHVLGKHPADQGDRFDTPSLRFLRGTGPYFHDGRYDTLEELLSDPLSSMGRSKALSKPDQAALAAYLRTL